MTTKKSIYKDKQKSINKTVINPTKGTAAAYNPVYILGGVLLITFLVYIKVLQAGFINWDDDMYIINNPFVKSIHLKNIFSDYVLGNYHPLTMLVYAVEYQFFELNPVGYHAVNLLLHLFNTLLVYLIIKRISENSPVALITALLFGIHPVHTESVAWIAELKDVLYTFFYLLAYHIYLVYRKHSQLIYYLLTVIFFVLSMLSKAMAVSFPLLLVLTDYYLAKKNIRKEKLTIHRYIIKIAPFFVLAFILGLVAIDAQKTVGAADVLPFSLWQRLVFASFSFVMYLSKLLIPFGLSAYYPYPAYNGAIIPAYYYFFTFLFVVLIVWAILTYKKNKTLLFGIGFFTLNILFVLQIKSVGGAIMADRYNYVASIGIFYLMSAGAYHVLSKNTLNKTLRMLLISVSVCLLFFYAYSTFNRSAVWKNSMAFWNDVIKQYDNIPIAYQNRGMAFMQEKRYEEALNDMNKALQLSPGFAAAYYNKALLHLNMLQYDEAIFNFDYAVTLNPLFKEKELFFVNAYYNRGTVLLNQNKTDEAYKDFCKTIELDSNYTEAYVNRGNILRDRQLYSEALTDYQKAIQIKPDFPIAYFNRGNLYLNQKKFSDAIADYNKAIALKPDYAKAFYNRGNAEYFSGNRPQACKNWQQAAQMGFEPATVQFKKACR